MCVWGGGGTGGVACLNWKRNQSKEMRGLHTGYGSREGGTLH